MQVIGDKQRFLFWLVAAVVAAATIASCVLLVHNYGYTSSGTAANGAVAGSTANSRIGAADVRASLRAQRRWKANERRRLSSAAAERERKASRTRFVGLTPADAKKSVVREQPKAAVPRWRPPALKRGEKIKAYISSNAARVDLPGEKADAIVESTGQPIATESRKGNLRPIDLALKSRKDGFTPKNAKIAPTLPANSKDPIRISPSAKNFYEIKLPGIASPSSRLGDEKLFYANTALDTDSIVESLPSGVEISWTVRSPRAPEAQDLRFTKKSNSLQFELNKDGSVELIDHGLRIGNVAAPFAVDAQGKTVEVRYQIHGDRLTVRTRHRRKDLAYPILIDPAVNFYGVQAFLDMSAGGYLLGSESYNFHRQTAYFANPPGTLWVATANQSPCCSSASFDYDPPNASAVFRAEWANVWHYADNTTLLAGIYGPSAGWGDTKWGAWVNGSSCVEVSPGSVPGCQAGGPFGNSGGMAPTPSVVACAWYSCQMGGQPGNVAGFALLITGNQTSSAATGFDGGYAYFSDYDNPAIANIPSQTGWTQQGPFTPVVSDGGVGLSGVTGGAHAGQALRVTKDGVPGPAQGPMCGGGVTSPCYTTFTGATVTPTDGEHSYQFTASDIVGHTTTISRTLKTDNTGPEIDISGRLGAFALESTALGTTDPRTVVKDTPFSIQATDGRQKMPDGSSAPGSVRQSGVKEISAKLYGSNATTGAIDLQQVVEDYDAANSPAGPKQSVAADCDENAHPTTAEDSCKLAYGGTFHATSPGIYYFRVSATDYANNTTVKDFKIGVGIASLESVTEGQASARYVSIAVQREQGSAATTSLQYRTKLNWKWCPVPADAIREATDPLSSPGASFPFDGNGTSGDFVLDLSALKKASAAGSCSMSSDTLSDGKVYVRALLAGATAEAARASEDVAVVYERGGNGTDDDSASIGPGSVDLVTGNFSISATDVSVDAFKSDLTVSRTYNSRYATKDGPLGPGWKLGLPSESVGIDLKRAIDYADVDLPEAERYPVVQIEDNSGSFMTFRLGESAEKYVPEPGLESFSLTRIPDAFDATRTAGFTLKDADTGATVSFATRPTGAPTGHYQITDVYQPGMSDKITYAYAQSTAIGTYITYAFAPAGGVTCRAANDAASQSYSTLPRGCQALKFNYTDISGTHKRLTSIQLKTFDPEASSGSGAMREETVSQYVYDASGRLIEQWDPRISPALKTAYTIVPGAGNNQIATLTPPGELPFTFSYLPSSGNNAGRLDTVTRSALAAGTATWSVRYGVPVHGSGAPFDFSVGETSRWGQEDPPFLASAVFPPDQPPNGTPATNYDRASISYLDPSGREVNSREPGGRIATTEYDKWGQVTRTLGAENRARAMAITNPADALAAAEKWDTENVYADVPGSLEGRRHLVEIFGPERAVRLDDGTAADARTHTELTYDEGSPIAGVGTKEPFDLVTTTKVSARVGSSDLDTRTSTATYGTTEDEWKLRTARQVTTDPGSGNLNIKRKLDLNADGLETARYQPRSQNSAEPSTTKTIYYTAGSNAEDSSCGNRPEWLGLACKVVQGDQPSTAGLPGLPAKSITYNYLRQPLVSSESVVDASSATKTRTTTATYDAAGRPVTESVSADIGEPVKTTKHVYSSTTGREVETQSLNSNGSVAKSITRTFDTLGRQTNYNDAEGHASLISYDLLSRVATTNDGKATRTNTYDAVTGDLTSVNDSGTGTFDASYDSDGRMVSTSLPGGMVKTFSYDEAGAQTYLSYTKTSGCSTACLVFENWSTESAHGQIRELWQKIQPQGQSMQESAYEYRYDKAGRLSEVGDWRNDAGTWKCKVREYVLDVDSNRTAKKSIPENNYYCDFGGSGTTETSSYDDADRIADTGYTYDAFGRITTTPQVAAGGTGDFTATYYANDLAHSVSQNGTTQTLELDPNLRMSVKTKVTGSNTTTETYAYTDDSDSPAWIQTGASTWQRYVDGIAGPEGVQDQSGARYSFTNLRGDVVAEGFPDPVQVADVDEFGVPKTDLPSDRRYGFHGSKQREALTAQGMIAMGVRLYAPRTGRFLQVDPVLGGSAGPYEYCYHEPVSCSDLDGRAAGGAALLGALAACFKYCARGLNAARKLMRKRRLKLKYLKRRIHQLDPKTRSVYLRGMSGSRGIRKSLMAFARIWKRSAGSYKGEMYEKTFRLGGKRVTWRIGLRGRNGRPKSKQSDWSETIDMSVHVDGKYRRGIKLRF